MVIGQRIEDRGYRAEYRVLRKVDRKILVKRLEGEVYAGHRKVCGTKDRGQRGYV